MTVRAHSRISNRVGYLVIWSTLIWFIMQMTRRIAYNPGEQIFWLIPIIFVIAVILFVRWNYALYVFIPWLVIEDLVRKYSGNNMMIYLVKDALATLIYISFFLFAHPRWQRRRHDLGRPPFLFALGMFAIYGTLQILNPLSPHVLFGLAGFKLYFYYIPLMFVAYFWLTSVKQLRLFIMVNLSLAALVAIIGLIQGIVGLDFLSPRELAPEFVTLGNLVRRAPTGAEVPRATSVFVSDGRYAFYLLTIFFIGYGSVMYMIANRQRGRLWSIVCLSIVTIAIFMSGVRSSVVYALVAFLMLTSVFLWQRPRLSPLYRRLFTGLQVITLITGIALFGFMHLFPQESKARWDLYAGTIPREFSNRAVTYPLTEWMKAFQTPCWQFGCGIGIASFGTQYITRFSGARRPFGGVESGYGNILIEMGILGLILWWIWTTLAIVHAWKIVLRMRGTPFFFLSASICWYVFWLLGPTTFTGNTYQNFILNAYLWIWFGILLALPRIAEHENRRSFSHHQ